MIDSMIMKMGITPHYNFIIEILIILFSFRNIKNYYTIYHDLLESIR